jgi:hypothetical protein
MEARSRWARPANLLVGRHTERVGQKIAPWSDRHRSSVRDGPSAPKEWKAKEQSSPVSTRDQRHLAGNQVCRTAGVRERPNADAGCHAAPRSKESFYCEYSGSCRKNRNRPQCVCSSEVAFMEQSTGRQSSFSQLKLSETGEIIFISNDAAHSMQRRRQRFPTVRMVG